MHEQANYAKIEVLQSSEIIVTQVTVKIWIENDKLQNIWLEKLACDFSNDG